MLPRQSDGIHCFFQILCKVQVVTVLESPGNRRSATTEVDDMAITVGMGEYVYEYQPEWPRLPVGQGFRGISGVAVDSHDRVYVFQRQGPPVLVFDPDGNPLAAWERTDGVPADAHHIHIGPDDSVYLVDRDAHQILRYSTDGALLSTIGARDRPALQAPFNHPADICVAPSGDLYVADGYGNSSVHRLAADGTLIASFGSPGRGPGEFIVPHSIRVSEDGRVYVADRENNRVQVFTTDGEFLDQWTDFRCPMGIHIDAQQTVYVSDQVPRLSILNLDGELLARGRTFEHAHQIYTDSQGNIYGADTSTQRVQKLARVR
jgi:DNA-binding beta-propeller fold protein YncE